MKIKHIKKLVLSEIQKVANNPSDYCFNPENDFTRNRKLLLETMLKGIIGMESGSLTNEMIDLFNAAPDMPTASAFIQQRNKIKPEAFKAIFDGFSNEILKEVSDKILHLNVLYELTHHIYIDAVIQKRMDWNEHRALQFDK